jgi:hypothetical protein
MRTLLISILAAALGLSSGLLAGCGNRNGLLPQTDANGLKHAIDQVGSAVARRDCARATTSLQEAQNRADGLPGDVDPKLRRAIDDGLSQLVQDVERECSTTTTSTQRTQTDTVPTQTTTTPTDTTTTPPNTATTPPDTTTTPDHTPTTPDQTGGTPPGQQKKQARRGAQN